MGLLPNLLRNPWANGRTSASFEMLLLLPTHPGWGPRLLHKDPENAGSGQIWWRFPEARDPGPGRTIPPGLPSMRQGLGWARVTQAQPPWLTAEQMEKEGYGNPGPWGHNEHPDMWPQKGTFIDTHIHLWAHAGTPDLRKPRLTPSLPLGPGITHLHTYHAHTHIHVHRDERNSSIRHTPSTHGPSTSNNNGSHFWMPGPERGVDIHLPVSASQQTLIGRTDITSPYD